MCLFGKAHKVAVCIRKIQEYLSDSSRNYFNFDLCVNTKDDWELSDVKTPGSLRLMFNMCPYNVMTTKYLTYYGKGDIVEELRKLTDELC